MNATRLTAALAIALLGACSTHAPQATAPSLAEPAPKVSLYFSADAGLNPGATGEPAPVRVRVYELKHGAGFARADYFALADQARATLGDDLLDQDEVLLRPGQQLRVDRPLNPATRQIGLVVGYREIDQARWRSLLAVPPLDYQISLDARAVRSAEATSQPEPVR